MKPSVLITGASAGIGASSAAYLARHGFDVFGTSRRPEAAAAAAPAIRWIAMDVRDEESVRRGVEQVLAAVPRLDALVANAGYGIFGSVEETSLEAAKQQFETNVFGVLRTLRAVLPGMRAAGQPGDIDTSFNERMNWGEWAESAYRDRIERAERVIRASLPGAPPPERVARVIHRALSARRPRARYTVGADSWLVPIGRRLLPDALFLRLIRQHFDV
jgi:NAD(P)-dependent dehydrogenase (short-subunit alcohol dehydrogenase family)